MHSEVAIEHAHSSDGLWTIIVKTQTAVRFGHHNWNREEGFQMILAGYRASARAAAAVRSRESLVKINMHHIHAEIAGSSLAYEGVHVGHIQLNNTSFFMPDAVN